MKYNGLHHLSRGARRQCIHEICRVLKPGGRLLPIDFGGPLSARRSWISHFHRHGKIDLSQMIPVFNGGGLHTIESGAINRSFGLVDDLHYVLATPGGFTIRRSSLREKVR